MARWRRRFRARQAQGGAPGGRRRRRSLPANEEIEAELRAYLALYQAEEHPERLAELRRAALDAMRALEQFNPY